MNDRSGQTRSEAVGDVTIQRALERTWWPVARLDDLRQPQVAPLLGRTLVVWRGASGRVFVGDDRCPHRGASLGLGSVRDDAIQCPYHGWRWDGLDGRCQRIPSLGPLQAQIPRAACLKTYPVFERWRLVWTCLDANPIGAVPDPRELRELDWVYGTAISDVDTNLLFSMENFRDVAHFPFVHRETFGVPEATAVEPLEVETKGTEVFLLRSFTAAELDLRKLSEAYHSETHRLFERGFDVTYHSYAPGLSCFIGRLEGGRVAVMLHCASPMSLESTRVFRVDGVSPTLNGDLERVIAFEDRVYEEDAAIAGSITPKRLTSDMRNEPVSTIADAYTLAFRRAFFRYVDRAAASTSAVG